MSSRWKYVAGTLVVLTLAYALVIAGQILLGLLAAVGIYGTAWLFATFRPDDGYIEALGPGRAAVLTLIAFVNLAYAVVIAGQVLLGVIAVCVVTLFGFLVAPGGPLTEARAFLERLRRVDRYVREQEGELTNGGRDTPDANEADGATDAADGTGDPDAGWGTDAYWGTDGEVSRESDDETER
jgi:hypothetical protein